MDPPVPEAEPQPVAMRNAKSRELERTFIGHLV
jgi:hypothetical protein